MTLLSDAARDYARAHGEQFRQELHEMLRIPSLSADPAHAGDVRRMAEWLADANPTGTFLVFGPGGVPVAQCRTYPAATYAPDDVAHVLDQPGIVPDYRAAGLHAPLALTAAAWLRERGARPVRLESWGDDAATIAIYQALGFALVEHEVSYVREVGG